MNDYGLFRRLCDDNAYSSLARTLSSAESTAQTQKTLKRITQKHIRYAHMGQLIIENGICYSTFIQNPGDDSEHHYSHSSGVVLAVFSLEKIQSADFDADRDIEFFKLGGLGDFCAGYQAVSIFKDNSMCLVGNLLHICFSFITDDGNSHIFRKTFDISGKTWVDEAKVILMYSGKEYDFSDASLNEIYRDKGFAPRAEGLIEMVSAWSQYQNEYYATGLAIEHPNNGFVVKTRDFRIMELVDIIPFNDMGMAEIASYIFMDRLFVACRQDYGIPYIYLGSLNLKKWSGSIITRFQTANQGPGFLKRTASYSFLTRRKKEIADI